MDGWVNLAKFLSTTLGVPGALMGCALGYVVWQLKLERDAHQATRNQIQDLNEKRIGLLETYLKALQDFKASIDALATMVKK